MRKTLFTTNEKEMGRRYPSVRKAWAEAEKGIKEVQRIKARIMARWLREVLR